MKTIDRLLENNQAYAAAHGEKGADGQPALGLAVVACMDCRIDVHAVLGLQEGEAHILRNAGGIVTDDVIRSLALSQHKLGTERVVLIHHTDCGLEKVTDEGFRQELERDAGVAPEFEIGSFDDVDGSVRESIRRLRSSPFLPRTDEVRGFVFDVGTGRLSEVDPE